MISWCRSWPSWRRKESGKWHIKHNFREFWVAKAVRIQIQIPSSFKQFFQMVRSTLLCCCVFEFSLYMEKTQIDPSNRNRWCNCPFWCAVTLNDDELKIRLYCLIEQVYIRFWTWYEENRFRFDARTFRNGWKMWRLDIKISIFFEIFWIFRFFKKSFGDWLPL